jgi:hypothetical protein
MRLAGVIVAFAAACGSSSGRRTNEVPDDLDVEAAMRVRPDGGVADAAPPSDGDAGMAQVKLEVLEEAPPPDGARIDLSVRDADVADVLRMIAAAAKVGLVVADDVRATVTLEVRNVTWRQAIDVIAHLEGLEVTEEEGIVSVRRSGAPR